MVRRIRTLSVRQNPVVRFIDLIEVWEWCEQHGVALEDRVNVAPDPSFATTHRVTYAAGSPSGRELLVARDLVSRLSGWDECLLWVVEWGIWESSEDWPAYYAARGAAGEKRSLQNAPGLLTVPPEEDELARFLAYAMENGWDAYVIPSRDGAATAQLVFSSHDEWAELRERTA
jgi:hypothetical protein